MIGILLCEDIMTNVVTTVYTTILIWFFIYTFTTCFELMVIFRCKLSMSETTEYYILHVIYVKKHFQSGLDNKTIFLKFVLCSNVKFIIKIVC
jgi:hypothetical protein